MRLSYVTSCFWQEGLNRRVEEAVGRPENHPADGRLSEPRTRKAVIERYQSREQCSPLS